MNWMQAWELASYVVTALGLPLAVAIFIYQQRRERESEDEEAYQMLVSLFERAYLVAWTDEPDGLAARRWASWDDYMREWLGCNAFHSRLMTLLRGEDPAFARHMLRLAEDERGHPLGSGQ